MGPSAFYRGGAAENNYSAGKIYYSQKKTNEPIFCSGQLEPTWRGAVAGGVLIHAHIGGYGLESRCARHGCQIYEIHVEIHGNTAWPGSISNTPNTCPKYTHEYSDPDDRSTRKETRNSTDTEIDEVRVDSWFEYALSPCRLWENSLSRSGSGAVRSSSKYHPARRPKLRNRVSSSRRPIRKKRRIRTSRIGNQNDSRQYYPSFCSDHPRGLKVSTMAGASTSTSPVGRLSGIRPTRH